jgi:AcrR family transcriptional regulator
MPPARGDHDARRRDVSEAVWRVLARHGFGGLTLRAVAAEMDASTGLLTHYFPAKRDLVAHALEILDARTRDRPLRDCPPRGMAGLRAMLLDILPLTPQSAALNRVWVSSWDVALADTGLGKAQADRYAWVRGRIRTHLADAHDSGELPSLGDQAEVALDDLAARALAFTHGLVVQALFDLERFGPERQTELLDAFLATFGSRLGG